MKKVLALASMMGLLAGCSGSSDGGGTSEGAATQTHKQAPKEDGDEAGAPFDDTPPPSSEPPVQVPEAGAPGCPDLHGTWTGQVQGTVKGNIFDTAISGKASGQASFGFVPGTAPNQFVLQDGSQMQMTFGIDGVGSFPFAQPVTGAAKCGVLDSTQDLDVGGLKVHVAAQCTFTDTNCSGTWNASIADGTVKAQGTFTVSKNGP